MTKPIQQHLFRLGAGLVVRIDAVDQHESFAADLVRAIDPGVVGGLLYQEVAGLQMHLGIVVRQELLEQGLSSNKAVESVYAEYASIRKTGIACSYGARRAALNALSVPLLMDHDAKVVAAVTVLGMAPQFDAKPASTAGRLLKQFGRELSSLLVRANCNKANFKRESLRSV